MKRKMIGKMKYFIREASGRRDEADGEGDFEDEQSDKLEREEERKICVRR